MDISRIKPHGPWVLLRLESPILYDGPGGPCQMSKGGIFIPATSSQDKLGYCRAMLLAKGSGKLNEKTGRREPTPVEVGESVYIRWYLSELNRPSQWDKDYCFLHQDDLLFVIEDDRYVSGVVKGAGQNGGDLVFSANVDALSRAMS